MNYRKYKFSRSFFERTIYYHFISGFIVKFIHELILGQWYFDLSPTKQFYFFGMIAVDYAFNWRKFLNIHFNAPISLIATVFFIIMIFHGISVGIISGNQLGTLLNDLVPTFVMAFSGLVMSSSREGLIGFNSERLTRNVLIISFLSIATGALALQLGRPSSLSVGGGVTFPIVCCLAMAYFLSVEARPRFSIVFLFIIILAIAFSELNRTNLLFIILCSTFLALKHALRNLLIMNAIVIILALAAVVGSSYIPESSPIYARISGLSNYDSSARTGSIGEREAEQDAIASLLSYRESETLGLGFGGVYTVQHTLRIIENTGHAHFGWALFYLRFGYFGYLYLLIFALLIIGYGRRNLQASRTFDRWYGVLIALYCLLHISSWFTFNFMLAGMQFVLFPRSGPFPRVRVPPTMKSKEKL